jgi:hypothetical protein
MCLIKGFIFIFSYSTIFPSSVISIFLKPSLVYFKTTGSSPSTASFGASNKSNLFLLLSVADSTTDAISATWSKCL